MQKTLTVELKTKIKTKNIINNSLLKFVSQQQVVS